MSAIPATAPPVARAVEAVKYYGYGDTAVAALAGITVDFYPQQLTAIMGPSGSGKSTLMHCMAGLDTLSSGQVFIGDVDLRTLDDKGLTRLRRDRLGFIFQAYNLIPTLTALENITLPGALAGREPDKEWLDYVVGTVNLGDRLTHRPSELSGGQQQRVAVARALAQRPELIFADEPTGNLDSRASSEILTFMQKAVKELGQTVVMVTHEPTAAGYADRVLFLADGRIVDEMLEPTAEAVLDRMKRFGDERIPMFKVALKNVLGHKVRVLLTALAVVAGVAFMAGTFVLTDTIKAGFDDLFTDANKGVDAVIRQKAAFKAEGGFQSEQRDEVSLDLLPTIEKVDGVASADAAIQGFAFIIDKDGDPLNPPGQAPQFGSNWPRSADMNPYEIVAGKPPVGADQAVVDKGSADKGHIGVGDKIQVQTINGPLEVSVSGIATFAGSDNQLGASFVLMEVEAAAKSFDQAGKAYQLQAHAEQGVSQDQLVANISAVLPKGVEAVTGTAATEEAQTDIEEGFNQFNIVLSGFAAVSLVAGAFLIYNIFGIVVAQRTRELAMLRALGASRKQVRRSVLIEAFVTGAVGSIVGLLGGIALAFLLVAALKAIGLDLPSTVPIVAPRTVIISLAVGLIVTMVSAFLPARRASKVLPLAAIREVALETGKRSPVRWIIGGLILALGVVLLVSGVSGHSSGPILGGVLLLFIGVVVVGPRIAGPITSALGVGAPVIAGLPGKMARQNAVRNPRRTSATAAAIVLTLMLVSTITIFFTSFTASINASVVKGLKADLEIASESFGFGGLSPDLARQVSELPQVSAAAGLRTGFAQPAGDAQGTTVWGTDGPAFDKLLDIGVTKGSLQDLTGDDTVAISEDESASSGKKVGSTVELTFPNGQSKELRVVAVYTEEGLIGQGSPAAYLLSLGAFEANEPSQAQTDQRVLVKGADGVSLDELRSAVEGVAKAYPTSTVRDVQEIQDAQTQFFTQVLGFVLVLLALSVLIGFLGIAITLALSVIERTRELGLLRAVGMNRVQVWLMVSFESVLIAMLGTFLGIALGLIGGISLATTFKQDIDTAKIDVPIVMLIIFCIVSALFGLIASVFPAWRASRLNVLDAVSHD